MAGRGPASPSFRHFAAAEAAWLLVWAQQLLRYFARQGCERPEPKHIAAFLEERRRTKPVQFTDQVESAGALLLRSIRGHEASIDSARWPHDAEEPELARHFNCSCPAIRRRPADGKIKYSREQALRGGWPVGLSGKLGGARDRYRLPE